MHCFCGSHLKNCQTVNCQMLKNATSFHGNAFYHLFQYLLHFVPKPVIPPKEAFLCPHNRY